MDGSVLEKKNYLLRYWGCLSLLNWIGAFTLSLLLKLCLRKLEPWFALWIFFLLRLLGISINLQYSFAWNTAVWAGAPSCYMEIFDKLQKWMYRTVRPSLAAFLEPLAHRWNVASLSLFYRYCLVDVHLIWLIWFHFLIIKR